jgi:hypothetical protein
MRNSVHAVDGAWKFGAETFGMRVINDLPLMLGLERADVIGLVKNADFLNKLPR